MSKLNYQFIKISTLTTPKNSNKVRVNWFFVVNKNNEVIKTQFGYFCHELESVAKNMATTKDDVLSDLEVIKLPVAYF